MNYNISREWRQKENKANKKESYLKGIKNKVKISWYKYLKIHKKHKALETIDKKEDKKEQKDKIINHSKMKQRISENDNFKSF